MMEPLGSGACGKVYLLELRQGRVKRIAIKKITRHPNDAIHMNEFRKKMKQVKSEIHRLRHKNLLPLLAYVSRPNCSYLVYRFMKNGSLQDILRELDWTVRHKVALGVAYGLEYIHISLSPRIVHLDLKPANILLDDNMKVYIADFGLAKSIPDTISDTHMTVSNVAGTTGYVAPEYAKFKMYMEKCDIISFGVILAVLVSRKFPIDEFFDHSNTHMIKWIRRVMTMTDRKQAIDEKLMGNGYEEQMLKVLKIACHCTLKDPKERPSS